MKIVDMVAVVQQGTHGESVRTDGTKFRHQLERAHDSRRTYWVDTESFLTEDTPFYAPMLNTATSKEARNVFLRLAP
jgi:hypothetical protein